MITNAFSVDVEEYFHAAIFRKGAGALSRGTCQSRVERSVELLLALLARHRAHGTFFVLGEVCRTHPQMVRNIAAQGHEIASHGDRHQNVNEQTPEEFRADIRVSKRLIEDAVGERVVGYRAPNFSIGVEQSWAYRVLLEEGFTYDSSCYPILHDRYGQPHAPRFPYEVWRDGAASLLEFPIGTARFAGLNVPIGGGGYSRLMPLGYEQWGIGRVNQGEQRPMMFYTHPWELDPDQPRPPMAWHHRFRHYVGLRGHVGKLDRLLSEFRFGTAHQILESLPVAQRSERELSPAIPVEPGFTA